MKSRFLFLLLFTSISTIAQNLIAVQNGGVPAFYTTMDAAIFNAVNGDTLFLPGGIIQATGNIRLVKSIHIVGVGYDADSNIVTGNTVIPNTIEILGSVKGVSITGIYAKSHVLIIHDSVSNIEISRCYFNQITIGGSSSVPASNISIIESVIDYDISASVTSSAWPLNVVIHNSFVGQFSTQISPLTTDASDSKWNGLTIKNCILLGSSWYYEYIARIGMLKHIQYSTFENCIILDRGDFAITGAQCYNNTFRNCLTNTSSSYIPPLPSNSIINCVFDQSLNDIFINNQSDYFTITNNYHLKPNSAGKNAGSDGTDIGFYGGVFPWKEGGIPFNPHIQAKNLSGKTDNTGNLNVNIKVAAQVH